MKFHILPIVGFVIGCFWIVASTIRYYIMWPDTSTLVIADTIGIIILGSAYILNWMKNKEIRDDEQDKRIDALVDKWFKIEWGDKEKK